MLFVLTILSFSLLLCAFIAAAESVRVHASLGRTATTRRDIRRMTSLGALAGALTTTSFMLTLYIGFTVAHTTYELSIVPTTQEFLLIGGIAIGGIATISAIIALCLAEHASEEISISRLRYYPSQLIVQPA